MSPSQTNAPSQDPKPEYDVGHTHPDISGGWLRAATYGAMDGLLSNTSLIAGVAAATATDEIHRDENRAVSFHLVRELGLDPAEKPSARLAAIASFLMFAVGAVIPLFPYLFGYRSLPAGLACGAAGLLIAGGLTARFTHKPVWWAASRQLVLGAVAVAATYLVGLLIGAAV